MTIQQIQQDIQRQLSGLSAEQQRRVLDFARSLPRNPIKGVKPELLRQFIGSIPVEDLEEMKTAIEADCEGIADEAA